MPDQMFVNTAIAGLLVLVLLVSLGQLFAALNRDNRLTRKHEWMMHMQTTSREWIDRARAVDASRVRVVHTSPSVGKFAERVKRLVESQHLILAMSEASLPTSVTISEFVTAQRKVAINLTLWREDGYGYSAIISEQYPVDNLTQREASDDAIAAAIAQHYTMNWIQA